MKVKLRVPLLALVLPACVTGQGAPNPTPSPASGPSSETPRFAARASRAFPPWSERRSALLTEYESLTPATQDERDWAEQQSLFAPPDAAPDPKLEWAQNEARNSGALLLAWCRSQTNLPTEAQLESCSLDSLGNGAVLLLTLVTECGGDSCSTQGYVLNASLRSFILVPHDLGGGAEASPTGDALFLTQITNVAIPFAPEEERQDPFGGQEPLILERVSLPSMQREPFAPCFSAKLSPLGRWLLCRDLAGNVLKLPLTGDAAPTLIASSGLARGESYFVWYAYIWPQPVEFVSDTLLEFDVVRADGESFQRELKWEE